MAFNSFKLLKWREAEKISQAEASRRLGIAQAYLSELESGKKEPSFSMLEILASKTGVSLGDFSTIANPTSPRDQEEN